MKYALTLSFRAAALLLASTGLGWAQPFPSFRCVVSAAASANGEIIFKVRADSFDLPPPQGLLVKSGSEIGLDFKVAGFAPMLGVPNYLVVSPSSGITPGWVWVGLNPNVVPYMPEGTYAMTVRFSLVDEPDKICIPGFRSLTLLVLANPPPAVTSVVNAASRQAQVSPGTVISILGTNLSTAPVTTPYDAAGLYPTALGTPLVYGTPGNSAVFLNGKPAPLLYVSQERIDAVIPHSLAGETTLDVVVKHGIKQSPHVRLPLLLTSPGIFTSGEPGGGLPIFNENGRPNGEDNPAPRGSEILLRATGIGAWNRSLPSGSIVLSSAFFPHYLRPLYEEVILRPQAAVSMTIGGQAAEIRAMGPVPYEVFGTLNVIAVVPEGIGSGPQPIVLTVGENSNVQQQVTLVVK